MTNEQFLQQFGHFIDAPNGIQKLREMVLQLAVRGKLAEQVPSDEPVSSLLNRIKEEKTRLIAEGKIKKIKALPKISEDEKLFELPHGWEWVRFGDIVNISTGKLDANAAVPGGQYPFFTCSRTPSEIDTYSYDTSAVLLAGNGDFNTKQYSGKFDVYQRTYVLEPVIWNLGYCFYTVNANIQRITENNRGSAIPYLKLGDITNPIVALPPLPEQHRIVAKVDELMALCDQLETERNARQATHQRLIRAVHHPLTKATDTTTGIDSLTAWRRIRDNFADLYTTLESVQALRQTILQLAVQGKLVGQDTNDEPASVNLQNIKSEQVRIIIEYKLRKVKTTLPLSQDEIPFDLPIGWEWIRFDELIHPASPISYGVLVPGPDTPNGIPFVRLADLDVENPPVKPEKSITAEIDSQYERTRLKGGEILMGVVGSIGKLGIAPNSWKGANIARAVCRIEPMEEISKKFLLRLLQSEYMQRQFKGDTRTLAQPTLNVGLIRSAPTPLPPLAEQHRIVTKVDELMTLCDQLETNIRDKSDTATRYAEAIVQQIAAA